MAFKMSGFSYPGKSPLEKSNKIPKDHEGRLEWARKPENRFRLKDLADPNSLMGGGQSKVFGQLLEQVQAEEAVGGGGDSEKVEAKQEQKTSLDTKVEVAPTGPGKAPESKKEE